MVESAQPVADRARAAQQDVVIPEGDRGLIVVQSDRCKGCGLCPHYCPPGVLAISEAINVQGYHPVEYAGNGCTGCAICFYICPEPAALTVYRREGK